MTAEPERPPASRSEGLRFAYATGARPLSGFTIKRGIGVGGFGEVYYALSDAGKEVALKRIQRHLDIELRGVRQCLNLKHVNLLSLYDIRYDDHGEAWVVMEYMLGESLRDVIERHPRGLPEAEVRRWFVGLASGTACLHAHGIVHRDLKPGNIFDDQGVVKLGDYGLSKFISCSRRSGQTESVGTFHYMAPEIGRGSYGKEIDIYALGVILYELLTGDVPFDGESTQEIVMKHLTADPDLSVVPAAYREPIRRALLKDPEHRYRSVAEMLAALRWQADDASGGARVARPAGVEPLYIDDDSNDMVFGPVREVVDAQVEPTGARRADNREGGGAGASGEPQPAWEREPIAATATDAIRRLWRWWERSELGQGRKLALVISVVACLAMTGHVTFPLLAAATIVYGVYFCVWLVVTSATSSYSTARPFTPPAASAPPPVRGTPTSPFSVVEPRPAGSPFLPGAIPTPAVVRHEPPRSLRGVEGLRPMLAGRRASERATELLGGYLSSFGYVAVLSVVGLVVGGRRLDGSLDTWSLYFWTTGMATLFSWTLLTLGKFWETRTADAARRRFTLLAVGLLAGLVGCYWQSYLQTPEPYFGASLERGLFGNLYSESGRPLAAAWMAYFGLLCFSLRWWKLVDPLRSSRLSVWSVAACGLTAFLLEQFFPLLPPWTVLTTLVATTSVQLAAPWVSTARRHELRGAASNAV